MKKLPMLFLFCLSLATVFALDYDAKLFQPKTLVVCFKMSAMPDAQGKLPYTLEDGYVKTGLDEFDKLAKLYKVTEIEPFISFVKDKNWQKDGVYIQNFQYLRLADNSLMDKAKGAFAQCSSILIANFESIDRVSFIPNDPSYHSLWHIPQIHCPEAWDIEQGEHSVIVGITDSGTKWNHPDLQANVYVNQAEMVGFNINWSNGTLTGNGDGLDNDGNGKIDDPIGWDFFEDNTGSQDNNPYQNLAYNMHGTHVAGCIGAVGNNGIGVVGPAPNISLLIAKGAPSNVNSTSISRGYDAIMYLADTGADIINASWGGTNEDGSYPNYVIDYAFDHGAQVVAAAGNDNAEHSSTYQSYPCDADNAICVAASSVNDVKANFSDYGTPIDVVAPGTNILSTTTGNSYETADGTSMASPITAGVMALIKSMYPDLSLEQLRNRLYTSCDNINAVNPNYIGKLGHGRINAYTALVYDSLPQLSLEETQLSELTGDGDGMPNPGETLKLKLKLYNEINWATATNLHATITSDFPGVTIIDNTAAWSNIPGGTSLWDHQDYFTFSVPDDVSSLTIPFTVTLLADTAYPYEAELTINVDLTFAQTGWPTEIGAGAASEPVFFDLDGNGTKELVFAETNGVIHALAADGFTEATGFPVATGYGILTAIAIDDLDNDGSYELITGTAEGHLLIYSYNGILLHDINLQNSLKNNPCVVNIDNTQEKEIIAITYNGTLYVLNADGTNYPNFPVSLGSNSLVAPAIGNIDGDDYLDIVASTSQGNVLAYSTATGQLISGFPYYITNLSWEGATLANLDGDPMSEIIIPRNTGHVYAIDNTGSEIFTFQASSSVRDAVAVGDINGDNSPELIFATYSGDIYALNTDGQPLAGFPVSTGNAIEASAMLADLNNDQLADIIIPDNAGKLHAVDYTGSELNFFPMELGSRATSSPCVGDFDGDGDIDIAVPTTDQTVVIDIKSPYDPDHVPWACFRGSQNRVANTSYQVTDSNDDSNIYTSTALLGNYPNPFNPNTNIKFNLDKAQKISLSIYNIKGQLVKSFPKQVKGQGINTINWNGVENNGKIAASGIYFYILKTEQKSFTGKMLMLK